MNAPRCALVCVGSELLRGKLNTHASTLAPRLAGVGLELSQVLTLGDDLKPLADAIRDTLERFEIVIVTGGLGPTFDDLSREAAALAAKRKLRRSPELLRALRAKFKRVRLAMPPANARQADLLEGAEAIPNGHGTAPGQWLDLPSAVAGKRFAPQDNPFANRAPLTAQRRVLILLPGPPSELHPMVDEFLLPRIRKIFSAPSVAQAHLHFVGVPESVVDQRIRPFIVRAQKAGGVQVRFTILAHLGLVDFDIFVTALSPAKARRACGKIVASVRREMGPAFYGMDAAYPLEKVVQDRFVSTGATLAVAESCTGGLLSARLTGISGSSNYFLGGIVSYANGVKMKELDVPAGLLEKEGAVSGPVAAAMAVGVRTRLRSSVGLSITGIAGPSGGTAKKPVGLVFIAIASGRTTRVHRLEFRGTRAEIRERSVITALDLLRTPSPAPLPRKERGT